MAGALPFIKKRKNYTLNIQDAKHPTKAGANKRTAGSTAKSKNY
jgi:hypothetical protein